jgi:hypothetical protein
LANDLKATVLSGGGTGRPPPQFFPTDEANVAWAREVYAVLRPHGMGGAYVNNLGDEGDERVKAAYGDNYDRLVMLKRKYDPGNLFRLNQNIQP